MLLLAAAAAAETPSFFVLRQRVPHQKLPCRFWFGASLVFGEPNNPRRTKSQMKLLRPWVMLPQRDAWLAFPHPYPYHYPYLSVCLSIWLSIYCRYFRFLQTSSAFSVSSCQPCRVNSDSAGVTVLCMTRRPRCPQDVS